MLKIKKHLNRNGIFFSMLSHIILNFRYWISEWISLKNDLTFVHAWKQLLFNKKWDNYINLESSIDMITLRDGRLLIFTYFGIFTLFANFRTRIHLVGFSNVYVCVCVIVCIQMYVLYVYMYILYTYIYLARTDR